MNFPYTLATLYSGSTGNATYICAGGAKILIDAGKCTRTLCQSLAELGVEVPTTWDEVKVTMSVLAKNQMEFGMLANEQLFASLLYQNGGEYYNEDGGTKFTFFERKF